MTALLVVVLDQVTKYGAGRWYHFSGGGAWWAWDGFVVNEGGDGFLPDPVRTLWEHPHIGAVLDVTSLCLLLGATLTTAGLLSGSRGRVVAAATAAVLAGFASNLADRLGVAALTHPGTPRGAIDWIGGLTPGCPNLADLAVGAGIAVLCTAAARARWRRPGPLLARGATAGLLVAVAAANVLLWTGWHHALHR